MSIILQRVVVIHHVHEHARTGLSQQEETITRKKKAIERTTKHMCIILRLT